MSNGAAEVDVVKTFALQIMAPLRTLVELPDFPALMRETEENLTDLLPDGYSVRIKEWDSE